MKALILNFDHFDNKEKTRTFYKFDVYDLEAKKVYSQFQDAAFTGVPNGVVPDGATCPAICDVTMVIDDYRDKEGIQRFRPNIKSINSWKKAEIK